MNNRRKENLKSTPPRAKDNFMHLYQKLGNEFYFYSLLIKLTVSLRSIVK